MFFNFCANWRALFCVSQRDALSDFCADRREQSVPDVVFIALTRWRKIAPIGSISNVALSTMGAI